MYKKIKKVQAKDLFAIVKLMIAFPVAYLYKLRRKHLWLICESGFEARDNGYWLYKYIVENYQEADVVFAIHETSPDFYKCNSLGETVNTGSIKHWIYYLVAEANISTHKGGKPNAAICYVLEVMFSMDNNRIFLQHGITLSDAKWLYYENTKFSMFVCATNPEYQYITSKFGYPTESVKNIGFCRFDTLVDTSDQSPKKLLIMPSWRNWLIKNTDSNQASINDLSSFQQSTYFKHWYGLLVNKEFTDYCRENNIIINFFPHRNIQPFLHFFKELEYINLCSWEDYDVQTELNSSSLLITDYSSVSLDFSYMNKPVVYYQFDEQEFRDKQYQEGYFKYKNDGFGLVVETVHELSNELINIVQNDFVIEKLYSDRINQFFKIRDNNNCLRTYNEIMKFTRSSI